MEHPGRRDRGHGDGGAEQPAAPDAERPREEDEPQLASQRVARGARQRGERLVPADERWLVAWLGGDHAVEGGRDHLGEGRVRDGDRGRVALRLERRSGGLPARDGGRSLRLHRVACPLELAGDPLRVAGA